MSKNQKKTEPRAAEAIIVEDPKEVIEPCRRVLRKAFGDIGFSKKDLAGNVVMFSMTGSEASTGVARSTYPVVPLIRKSYATYWLGAVFQFRFEQGRFRLISASLLVFKGQAYDPIKQPMLRAEWDSLLLGDPSQHAQPHWHVYRSVIREELELIEAGFGASDSEELEAVKFHFAMCSAWYKESESHQEKLNEIGKLLSWLQGCISYTRRQIELLPV